MSILSRYKKIFSLVVFSILLFILTFSTAEETKNWRELTRPRKNFVKEIQDSYSKIRSYILKGYEACQTAQVESKEVLTSVTKINEIGVDSQTDAINASKDNLTNGIRLTEENFQFCEKVYKNVCNRKKIDEVRENHQQRSHALQKKMESGIHEPSDVNDISAHNERIQLINNHIYEFCHVVFAQEVENVRTTYNELQKTKQETEWLQALVDDGDASGNSGGGFGEWVKENPLAVTAIGGGVVLGGGLLAQSLMNQAKEEKEKEKEKERERDKLFEMCVKNMSERPCVRYFLENCTSEADKDKEGCSEFNKSFCGPLGGSDSDSHTGLIHSIQYCTLIHARSQCASTKADSSSPSCQWLEKISQSETCQQNPFESSCLPEYENMDKLSQICKQYPNDVVCQNTLNSSPKFTVIYKEPSGEESNSSTKGSSKGESTSPEETGHSQFVDGTNILFTPSQVRQLCKEGKLYDCN